MVVGVVMEFHVTEFSGPLDLLLDLVEKSKIDIYDIPIAEITSQFLEAMNEMDIPAHELSQFIDMASILLYLKTKHLMKDQEEEEEEEEFTKEQLIEKLLEYKKYKQAAKTFRVWEEEAGLIYSKWREDLTPFEPDAEEEEIIGDPSLLEQMLKELIERQVIEEKEFAVEKIMNIDEYSLEKTERRIRDQLQEQEILSLTDVLSEKPKKTEVIIAFLSILELCRMRVLYIIQEDTIQLKARFEEEEDHGEEGEDEEPGGDGEAREDS